MLKEDFQKKVFLHRHKMYRFAVSLMKDQEEAKDIVQEVLLKLWENRRELEQINNVEAWCMTLIRNKSLDALKRSGKKLNDSFHPMHESSLRSPSTPLEVIANQESVDHVIKLADKLPEKQKTAFTLREIQGYSYIEICDIMGISMSQCKVNIFRARNTLKAELKKQYSYD